MLERLRVETSRLELQQSEGELPKLVGVAAFYGVEAEQFPDLFVELAPGAFGDSVRGDVRALLDHQSSKVLGRTTARTLVLNDRPTELGVEIIPPNNNLGRDTTESVRRGDLSQMSIGFETVTAAWETRSGRELRVISEAKLREVSIVTFPVFDDTSIAVKMSRDRWRESRRLATETRIRRLKLAELGNAV